MPDPEAVFPVKMQFEIVEEVVEEPKHMAPPPNTEAEFEMKEELEMVAEPFPREMAPQEEASLVL